MPELRNRALPSLVLGAFMALSTSVTGVAQSPSAAPLPSAQAMGLAAGSAEADEFWAQLRNDASRQGFASLRDAVDVAHLIIVGRPSTFVAGPYQEGSVGPDGSLLGAQEHMLMRIALDDVLAGTPVSSQPGFVDVLFTLPAGTSMEAWRQQLPRDEQVLFILYNLGERNSFYGAPEAEVEATRAIYTRLNDAQGVFRNIDGVVKPLSDESPGADVFPAAFVGRPFADLVGALRTAAARP